MKVTTPHISNNSIIETIKYYLDDSIAKNICFSAWRHIGSSSIFIGLGDSLSLNNDIFTLKDPYFVFSPFKKGNGHEAFPIQSLFELSEKGVKTIFSQKILEQKTSKKLKEQTPTSKNDYIAQVEKAIGYIKIKAFHKVVISKIKKVKVEKDAYLKAFESLSNELHNSFVSLVYTPQTGLWIGATPEILLEKEKKQLKTVALAGTQPNTFENIREAFWRQKEIEEQAYVSRYIVNCFKKIRLREFEENGPKTTKAGNLLHLKTEYLIDLNQVDLVNLPDTLLNLIHPTSAVCGMPLDESLQFIEENESHQRTQYAGYLGPVGIDNKSSLYVNLRCAQFVNDSAYIYSGAGITEDSIPEKEWEETELKCDTILKRLI